MLNLTYPPENGFGAAGVFCVWAKFPNVIVFSDEPRLSNRLFFCGDVYDGAAFILANVPNPFGLPNVELDPNFGPEPNVGFALAATAVKPNPCCCCCGDCGDPKPL